MILLTRSEAEAVLGPSPIDGAHALEPAPLKNGKYVLPEDVLDEPANADVEKFLATKVVPGDPDPSLIWDFGTPEEPNQAEIDAYNALRLTWSEGGAPRAAAAARTKRSQR